jgi:hypothetical protein
MQIRSYITNNGNQNKMSESNQCRLTSPHTPIRNMWPDMASTAHTHFTHFAQRRYKNFADHIFQNEAVNVLSAENFRQEISSVQKHLYPTRDCRVLSAVHSQVIFGKRSHIFYAFTELLCSSCTQS